MIDEERSIDFFFDPVGQRLPEKSNPFQSYPMDPTANVPHLQWEKNQKAQLMNWRSASLSVLDVQLNAATEGGALFWCPLELNHALFKEIENVASVQRASTQLLPGVVELGFTSSVVQKQVSVRKGDHIRSEVDSVFAIDRSHSSYRIDFKGIVSEGQMVSFGIPGRSIKSHVSRASQLPPADGPPPPGLELSKTSIFLYSYSFELLTHIFLLTLLQFLLE